MGFAFGSTHPTRRGPDERSDIRGGPMGDATESPRVIPAERAAREPGSISPGVGGKHAGSHPHHRGYGSRIGSLGAARRSPSGMTAELVAVSGSWPGSAKRHPGRPLGAQGPSPHIASLMRATGPSRHARA